MVQVISGSKGKALAGRAKPSSKLPRRFEKAGGIFSNLIKRCAYEVPENEAHLRALESRTEQLFVLAESEGTVRENEDQKNINQFKRFPFLEIRRMKATASWWDKHARAQGPVEYDSGVQFSDQYGNCLRIKKTSLKTKDGFLYPSVHVSKTKIAEGDQWQEIKDRDQYVAILAWFRRMPRLEMACSPLEDIRAYNAIHNLLYVQMSEDEYWDFFVRSIDNPMYLDYLLSEYEEHTHYVRDNLEKLIETALEDGNNGLVASRLMEMDVDKKIPPSACKDWVVKACKRKDEKLLKKIIEGEYVGINDRFLGGWTPVHFVALYLTNRYKSEIIQWALEAGADFYVKNNKGESAMQIISNLNFAKDELKVAIESQILKYQARENRADRAGATEEESLGL